MYKLIINGIRSIKTANLTRETDQNLKLSPPPIGHLITPLRLWTNFCKYISEYVVNKKNLATVPGPNKRTEDLISEVELIIYLIEYM